MLGMISATGLGDADGAGLISFRATVNRDGNVSPALWEETYSVQPDGTVAAAEGLTKYRGGLSPGGMFVLLGGTTSAGSNPVFRILVRK